MPAYFSALGILFLNSRKTQEDTVITASIISAKEIMVGLARCFTLRRSAENSIRGIAMGTSISDMSMAMEVSGSSRLKINPAA